MWKSLLLQKSNKTMSFFSFSTKTVKSLLVVVVVVVFVVVLSLSFATVLVDAAASAASSKTAATTSQVQSSVPLTKSTFDFLTQDKTVFLKFYAPWCGYCEELAPIWERMAAFWKDHPHGFVGEVDCTSSAEVEAWCSTTFYIQGFPTLLYGDPSQGGILLEEYTGDNTYEALVQFANATLQQPTCSVAQPHRCDAVTRAKISTYMNDMTHVELDAAIAAQEQEIANLETALQERFDDMQQEYNRLAEQKEMAVAAFKYNLKMLKAVQEAGASSTRKK